MENIKPIVQGGQELINSVSLKADIHPDILKQKIGFLNEKGYQLIGYLGKGAFAIVISARSLMYGDVAIKIISENEDYLDQDFKKEEDIMDKLIDPQYSIKLYKAIADKTLKSYFFISELCDSNSLLYHTVESNNVDFYQQQLWTRSYKKRNQQWDRYMHWLISQFQDFVR